MNFFIKKPIGILILCSVCALLAVFVDRLGYFEEKFKVRNPYPLKFDDPDPTISLSTKSNEEVIGPTRKIVSTSDYDAAWSTANTSGPPETDRLNNLMGVVETMAGSGHAEDAITKIIKTFGPGESRSMLVNQVFTFSNSSEGMEVTYSLLEFDDERDAACRGLAENLSKLASPDQLDLSKFSYLGPRIPSLIATVIERYVINNSSGSAEELSTAFKQSFKSIITPEIESEAISKIMSIAPFDCWDHLAERGLETLDVDRNKLVYEMIYNDPAKTLEKLSSTSKLDGLFTSAFSMWMKNDASQPIEWLEQNKNVISPAQKDAAIQGITIYALDQHEYQVAAQWAQQIQNEKARVAVIQEIEKSKKPTAPK